MAYGFAIVQRADGEGLEIPLQLLMHIALIKGSMDYDGNTIFVGPSRVLFPTRLLRQGIQWHYVGTDDNQVLMDRLKNYGRGAAFPEISTLNIYRTFLGSYRHALVYAGTNQGLQSGPVSDSKAAKSSSRLEISRELSLTAGLSTHGVSAGVGTKWILPRALHVSLRETQSYDDRLQSAKNSPVLVYDLSAKSAWLVSELSMILHMIHKYLRHEDRRGRWCRDENMEPWPLRLYAEPSPDGGDAAYSMIRDNGQRPLYTKLEDDKNQEFRREVDTFLKVFQTIRTAEQIKKSTAGWKVRTPRLRGWDFNELADKEEEGLVPQRELSSDSKKSPWWSLAEVDDMIILLGRDFGQLIRPNVELCQPYRGWDSMPTQAELLTASMTCVKQLSRNCNAENCERLTSELYWHRPTKRCCTTETACSDGCTHMLELRTKPPLGSIFGTLNPPGRLCNNEAVIFGDITYYHDVVKKRQGVEVRSEPVPEDVTVESASASSNDHRVSVPILQGQYAQQQRHDVHNLEEIIDLRTSESGHRHGTYSGEIRTH